MIRYFPVVILLFAVVSCAKESHPTSGDLNNITVVEFPEKTSGGLDWDSSGDGPDLYITVDTGNTTIYTSPIYFNNATSPSTYYFTFDDPFNYTEYDTYFWINFYDYDSLSTNDDFMGTLALNVSEHPSVPKDYPSSFVVEQGDFKIQADFFWYWN